MSVALQLIANDILYRRNFIYVIIYVYRHMVIYYFLKNYNKF